MVGGSRSAEIVAELRGEIESGRLAPGERVPSTREITRRWGVAMATATKVLTELRRAGLVRAVPGVGTVVEPGAAGKRAPEPARGGAAGHAGAAVRGGGAPPPRRPAAEPGPLAERIVEVAVAIADAEGLGAVSMRRVAAELGLATMSLYRHVADKDALLLRMMELAFAQWPLPAEGAPQGWRERLTLASRSLWQLFRAHPWLAPAVSLTRPQPVASAIPYTEWVLATLEAEGLDLADAFTAHLVLLNYIRGTAMNLEQESEAEARTGLDHEEWMDSQEPALAALMSAGSFPAFGRLSALGYEFDLDALFESGLHQLLNGLAVRIRECRGAADR